MNDRWKDCTERIGPWNGEEVKLIAIVRSHVHFLRKERRIIRFSKKLKEPRKNRAVDKRKI